MSNTDFMPVSRHEPFSTVPNRTLKLLLVIAICFLWLPARAQTDYRIEKYDTRNGLQGHWVSAVQQDKAGFIWLALQDGRLARFDGQRFEHFAMNTAERQIFGGNSVLNLQIDSADQFSVMIQQQWARFDPATGRFFRPDPKDSLSAPRPDFFKLTDGRDWEKNWQILDHPKRIIRRADGANFVLHDATLIYGVLETKREIWVAAFEGLYKITPRKRLFETPFSVDFELKNGPVTGMSCYGIAESGDWLWFIGDKSLCRTSLRNPGKIETVLPADVVGGTYQMLLDRRGWLWPGRFSLEIARFNARSNMPFRPENPAQVTSIKLPATALPEIRSFLEMPDGKMWIATSTGILEIAEPTGPPTQILAAEISGVWHLYLAPDGQIWAATEQGLFRLSFAKNTGKWQVSGHFTAENCHGFGANKILSIQAAEGFLWLGSDAGLIRFHPTQLMARTFSLADGMPHRKVYFAVPDGGFLWCGTDRGLARVTLASAVKSEGLTEIRTFHVDDGLPHEEFNTLAFFKSQTTGKIYLGGLNGLTIFSPKDLEDQKTDSAPLHLIRFEKYDRRLDSTLRFSLIGQPETTPVVLEHFDQFFTLHFALLDYTDPSHNRYRYRMEGFEKNWIEAGNNNFARYTALPPGHYVFRVQAADHNGNWNPTKISLPVVVKQAWFRSWWAWLGYLLIALGVGFAVYRQRMQQVRLASKAQFLEELVQFKSRFFTNISHEFRTPLTVILGTTEQVKNDVERLETNQKDAAIPPIISKLGLLRRNGENLLRLINHILDLAKIEDNSLKLNYVQGNVVAYLRYVVESLHTLANAKNVLLRMESTETNLWMDYDPDRLLAIVHNLLTNALKFTPSGGQVTLLAHSLAHQKQLEIKVADTGIGISTDELTKIFDRFYQVDHQTNTGGTGIGLALTKELVAAMSGQISVESEVGKGTIFTVRLPVTHHASALALAPPNPFYENIIPKTPPPADAPHILLIEDNPDVVAYLTASLAEKYQIHFAYNGRVGIEMALETVPDLIISDVMMPEKDGFEVCHFLKNDARTSHIPIVLLTARADAESRLTGLRRGADIYLAKPFQPEELLAILENLLKMRRRLQQRNAEFGMQNTESRAADPNAESNVESSAANSAFRILHSAFEDFEGVFLKKVQEIFEKNLGNADFGPEDICRQVGMGQTNLNLKLNALTGVPAMQYLRKMRLHRAKKLLLESNLNVSEIAWEVGFNDPKYFSRVFSEEFGMPPSGWRKN